MDKVFLVANLKSYKTQKEASDWLEVFRNIDVNLLEQKLVIVCPPFTLLEFFKSNFALNNLNVKIGAQNISPFEEGPYTGEVNAKQIKEFADYVLIGHSERRSNFSETEVILKEKINRAIEVGLEPILLVQNENTPIATGIKVIAYEPTFAIGSGNPDTPENAEKIATSIKQKGDYRVLYGGSLTSANIKGFTSQSNIDGALIGGASLEAEEFIKIIENA